MTKLRSIIGAVRLLNLKLKWVICVLGLFVFGSLMRLPTLKEPFETDITTYAVMAHELLQGWPLYSYLWDNKPPGIFVIYAFGEALVGYGYIQIFFLNLLAFTFTLLGCCIAAVRLSGSRWIGVLGGLFWCLLSIHFGLQANQPNTEVFMNGLIMASYALILGPPTRSYLRFAGIGILLGLSTLLKQVGVVYAFGFALAHFASKWTCSKFQFDSNMIPSLKQRLIQSILIVCGTPVLWAFAFLYFFALDRGSIFFESSWTYAHYYSGSILRNLQTQITSSVFFPDFFPELRWLLPISVCALGYGWYQKKTWLLYSMAYFLATPAAIGMPGKFFPHYYQFWLPLLSVFCAQTVRLFWEISKPRFRFQMSCALIVGLVFGLSLPQIDWYRLGAEGIARKKYGGSLYSETIQLSRKIEKLLPHPQSKFYHWGTNPGFFFFSKRHPTSGILWSDKLIEGSFKEHFTQETLRVLQSDPPQLIVIDQEFFLKNFDHPVPQWILGHYRFPKLLSNRDKYLILKRS